MKARWFTATAMCCVLVAGLGAHGWAQELPTHKGKKIVAAIDGEPITLMQFEDELASIKKGNAPGRPAGRAADAEVLRRMINARLITQEARRIGLDKLPEVVRMVDGFSKEALRSALAEIVAKDVKADEKEVGRLYKAAIQEWKVSAVLFDSEADAKPFLAELATHADFSQLAKEFVGAGKAKKAEEGVYVKVKDMDPQLGPVVSKMAVGATSPVVHTKSGFMLMRLEDIRYVDSKEKQDEARQAALAQARQEALRAFDESLKKKHAKVNRDLLRDLDYEAPTPGFEALLKDTRVLAEIRGETPVTVGDLTEQLRYQFYHGTAQAAEQKRINARKEAVLDGLLHRKLFRKEALRRGLQKTDAYRSKVAEYENGMLFGMFLNKVIVPEIKIGEDEVRAYYGQHIEDYRSPEMVKIRSLVFASRSGAEAAVEKLKAGTEIQWFAAHAAGQMDTNAKGVLTFDGRPIMTDDLPGDLRQAIAGAKAGDFRLYAAPEGHYYALAILDVMPAKPQPYEQARQQIAQRVFAEKQKKAVEEYANKLRALSDVKVYLKS
jgi:parvulin-like peptidyl-prolyl isomerase